MFHQLNNLKFRFIVLASLGAPLMLLWIAGYYSYDSWRTYRIQITTMQANKMADNIISAAAFQAIERGVAAGLLSSSGPAAEAGRAKIAELRAKSDGFWREADTLAAELEIDPLASPGLLLQLFSAPPALFGASQINFLGPFGRIGQNHHFIFQDFQKTAGNGNNFVFAVFLFYVNHARHQA